MASLSFSLRNTGSNELAAAVRFVAGREAAREHDNLRMLMRSAISSTEALSSAESLFLKMKISETAPALSKALALSTSQLLPGMVGMKTLGLATLVCT